MDPVASEYIDAHLSDLRGWRMLNRGFAVTCSTLASIATAGVIESTQAENGDMLLTAPYMAIGGFVMGAIGVGCGIQARKLTGSIREIKREVKHSSQTDPQSLNRRALMATLPKDSIMYKTQARKLNRKYPK